MDHMKYGILIIIDNFSLNITNLKLYDFNKNILFQLEYYSNHFFPYKINPKEEIIYNPITEHQFYDILNNLKLDKKFLKYKDFCLRYHLEELII